MQSNILDGVRSLARRVNRCNASGDFLQRCPVPTNWRSVSAKEAAEKGPHPFCHSEVVAATEESLLLYMALNRRVIPRFARNDKINYFFRSLKMLSDEVLNDWGACPRRVGLAVMAKNVNCPLSRGDV